MQLLSAMRQKWACIGDIPFDLTLSVRSFSFGCRIVPVNANAVFFELIKSIPQSWCWWWCRRPLLVGQTERQFDFFLKNKASFCLCFTATYSSNALPPILTTPRLSSFSFTICDSVIYASTGAINSKSTDLASELEHVASTTRRPLVGSCVCVRFSSTEMRFHYLNVLNALRDGIGCCKNVLSCRI